MHSNYPCSLWYVLECCCYCTFFEVQFLVSTIIVWTCLTVFFLGRCSKYYIVTSRICCSFVCYFDSRSAYCYVCDKWCIWCDCCYREWISIRPFAKYFLTVLITFPSVAVCVVCSLLYIFKCSRSLYLILADGIVVLVFDAVTVCRDYIVVTTAPSASPERITVALLPATFTLLMIGVPTLTTSPPTVTSFEPT